jgi:AraC-like DNA-binding protein
MRFVTPELRETHILGRHTREHLLHRTTCPELGNYGIIHMGLSVAAYPYAMVRLKPKFAHLLICTDGIGKVLVNGHWEHCRVGDTYLSPVGAVHAFHAIPRKRWQFAFVIYDQVRPWHQYLPRTSTRGTGDGYALSAAIEGLYREVGSTAKSEIRLGWISLLELYWQQIVAVQVKGGRLTQLWEKVDQELAHPWCVEELARKAGLSRAQLRRIARAETGHSPLMHVTRMRMNRAANLLQSSPLKIEAIAEAVGYANPFAFSSAFRRCMGRPPSLYC